jgi:single-strand DNA-binding protein
MYQKITIVGRLGQDPEMRFTSSGTAVTSLNVATDRSWTNKETGQREKKTIWFKVAVWGSQAEPCNQYLAKGRMVLVEGEMEEPKVYKSKSGEYRSNLELRAFQVTFLGGTKEPTQETSEETSDPFDIGDEEIPF